MINAGAMGQLRVWSKVMGSHGVNWIQTGVHHVEDVCPVVKCMYDIEVFNFLDKLHPAISEQQNNIGGDQLTQGKI